MNPAKLNNHDKKIYEELFALIPEAQISAAANYNFAGFSFPREMLDWVWNFEDKCKNYPSFFFVDKELETLRKELLSADIALSSVLAIETFPCNNPTDSHSNIVPPEWEDTQPERFRRVVDEIHKNTQKCFNAFSMIVRSACSRPE